MTVEGRDRDAGSKRAGLLGPNRLVVIGVDGATFDVMLPLVESGRLPTFARLLAEGAWGPIRSTIPNMTPPAWLSIMTGMDPGQHGIFDFRALNTLVPDQHLGIVYGSRVARGRTFWEALQRQFRARSAILFVPMTYPVWPIDGLMVSGYPSPDTMRGRVWPRGLEAQFEALEVKSNRYRLGGLLARDLEGWVRRGADLIRRKTDALLALMGERAYGCLFLVYSMVDLIQHFFWKYQQPEVFPWVNKAEAERWGGVIDQMYEVLDENLGRIVAALDPASTLFVLSDHGFGHAARRRFSVNRWLRDEGWLVERAEAKPKSALKRLVWRMGQTRLNDLMAKAASKLPHRLRRRGREFMLNVDVLDFSRTAAFHVKMPVPAEGVAINAAGRYPWGWVGADRYEALRTRIIERALALRDPQSGQRIVEQAYRREELYHGDKVSEAPDVILVLASDYIGIANTDALVRPVPQWQLEHTSGTHREEGIFVARGRNVQRGHRVEGATLLHVAPTVLYACGAAVPQHARSDVLEAIFTEEYRRAVPLRREREAVEAAGVEVALSAEEEETLRRKLRGLGYLE